MSEPKRVYWKRRENEQGLYISGTCGPHDVPSYGEFKALSIPTEIVTTVAENGTLTAISPPVIGTSKAYRYTLQLTRAQRADTQALGPLDFNLYIRTEYVEAPDNGTERENWWWYSHDKFQHLPWKASPPVRLMKKWRRGMLEILLEGHPQAERHLTDWDARVAAHKAHVRARGMKRTPAHRKKHGDLVVLPRPHTFEDGSVKQIFRFQTDGQWARRKTKHSLYIGSMRYRTPHGVAMTFADGQAPDARLAPPIRLAMVLLAWGKAPRRSAHEILAAEADFSELTEQAFVNFDAWSQASVEESHAPERKQEVAAAISALADFAPQRPSDDAGAGTLDADRRLQLLFASALSRLNSALASQS